MIDAQALSRFASDMAAAFNRLAEGLAPPSPEDRARIVAVQDVSILLRGSRQRAVFKYLLTVGDEGASTGQINDNISYDFSNTYTTLHRLEDLGFIEMLPGASVQTWRIVDRYRSKSAG
jgi:hypothetical protein